MLSEYGKLLKFIFAKASMILEMQNISAANIMAYGSMPYVGMAPKKNGGHIKSAQMTRSKCLR